ncbi:hypothetical protein ANO11243_084370 [Dothideomycetidae sp. 11243]|nr:hypothetical protein ANO11243_084370 [fungal sp. No.11243]
MDIPSLDPGFILKLATVLLVKARKRQWRWLVRVWPRTRDILIVRGKAIKVQYEEHLGEAQTMHYLDQHTAIPVPKVFWAFTFRGKTYTVTSEVKGHRLCEGWLDRSQESKDAIISQLREMLTELRALPHPPGIGVASITGGSVFDSCNVGDSISGPFKDVKGFYKMLMGGNDLDHHWPDYWDDLNTLSEFYRQADYDLVFTHGDLSMYNIMALGDQITGIIDWETAGWYPSFWEYTKAKNVNPFTRYWGEEIDRFMTPLPHELAMDKIRLRYFDWYGLSEGAIDAIPPEQFNQQASRQRSW